MVGVVTFGARKAGRRSGSGFVFARDAGGTNPVVKRRSCERSRIYCGGTFKTDTEWTGCIGHVVARRFISVLTSKASPTKTVDDGAVGGAGCGGVCGGGGEAAAKCGACVCIDTKAG